MMTYVCLGCGKEVHTDNEDDVVIGLCVTCQEYGSVYLFAYEDDGTVCDCEDYPCCGC